MSQTCWPPHQAIVREAGLLAIKRAIRSGIAATDTRVTQPELNQALAAVSEKRETKAAGVNLQGLADWLRKSEWSVFPHSGSTDQVILFVLNGAENHVRHPVVRPFSHISCNSCAAMDSVGVSVYKASGRNYR